jgi:hypothetical protein
LALFAVASAIDFSILSAAWLPISEPEPIK